MVTADIATLSTNFLLELCGFIGPQREWSLPTLRLVVFRERQQYPELDPQREWSLPTLRQLVVDQFQDIGMIPTQREWSLPTLRQRTRRVLVAD